MPKRDTLDGLVLHRLARARDVVHVQPERVPDPVREERRAHAAREDRLLGVPRARVGRVWLLEDAEALEAADERAVAEELDRVPVQAGLERFHRKL